MITASRVLALAILMTTVGLVGCIGGTGGPPATTATTAEPSDARTFQVVEDPEGDAYQRPSQVSLAGIGVRVCDESGPMPPGTLPEEGENACNAVVDEASQARPAPPGTDILGVQLTETRESFIVELEMAAVDAEFAWMDEVATAERAGWLYFIDVCLHPVEGGCESGETGNYASHGLQVRALDGYGVWGGDRVSAPPCGSAGCWGPLDLTFEEGSPGQIVWSIPRGYMPGLAQGDTFNDLKVSTSFATGENLARSYVIASAGDLGAGVFPMYGYSETFDESAPGAGTPFSFEGPQPGPEEVQGSPVVEDPVDDIVTWGDPPPEDPPDLLSSTLVETPSRITSSARYDAWAADLESVEYYILFGIEGGGEAFVQSLIDGDVSTTTAWVNTCMDTGDDACWAQTPAETEVVQGEPGWVNVTFARQDLGSPAQGARITDHYLWYELPAGANPAVGAANAEVSASSWLLSDPGALDDTGDSRMLYRLVHDTDPDGAPGDPNLHLVPDGTGDYEPPAEVAAEGSQDEFDITHVQVQQTELGTTRFELGIAGLAGADTPPTYDGRAYVVGVQTDDGDFMMGFYEGPGQTPDSFFCAPDTLLFRGQPADPSGAVLTPIEGKPVAAQSGGALVFEVPADECLADTGDGSLDAEALAAGTFLLRNTAAEPGAGEVTPMDRADHDEPLTLMAASVPTATDDNGSWWSNAEIWLFGLGALLVGAEGWILLGRRRRLSEARAEERELAYANLVKDGVETGASSDELKERLKPTRAALGISEKQHAHVEAEVRSRVAAVTGGPRGLVPGEVFLDRYEVIRFLAAGGAGRTYLCRDTRLDREVVLKVLRAPGDDADMDPVLREARAFSALRHEQIVTLHDIEAVGDDVYLVLEAVAGGSLRDRLDQGPLGHAEMARLGEDLLSGLAAVHTSGIVHRDVKPSNVLVTAEGRFKLADFGIAHMPGYEETIGGLGLQAAVGTVRYMSPEQARGEAVDARSDLYSAAVTLYEAWTGVPFLAPSTADSPVEVQLRAASGQGSLEGCDRGSSLRAFFERALAVDADERFASAKRMRVAFMDALRSAEARPPGRGGRDLSVREG